MAGSDQRDYASLEGVGRVGWAVGCILLLEIRCFRDHPVVGMGMRRLAGRCRLGRGGIRLGLGGGLGLEGLEAGILFRSFNG